MEAHKHFSLDEVWLMVTPHNPLKEKSELEDFDTRFEQCELLSKDLPWLKVSDFEQKSGSSYTCDTVKSLTEKYPDIQFIWLMGVENLTFFHKWKNWQEILKTVPIATFSRGREKTENALFHFEEISPNTLKDNNKPLNPLPSCFHINIHPHTGRATHIRQEIQQGHRPEHISTAQWLHIQEKQAFTGNHKSNEGGLKNE